MTTGNVADLKLNPATNKWEAIFNNKVLASSPDQEYVERVITGGFSKKAKAAGVSAVRVITVIDGKHVATAGGETVEIVPVRTVEQEFDINERFTILQDYVEMVGSGELASALITGEGGLGKSFTTMKSLKQIGLRDITQVPVTARNNAKGYVIVKGYSTAKGLYRTLYENRNQIIVFDDCDSILRDPTAVNVLKAALDSYDERIVTWNAENGFGEDDLPKSFTFEGGVIFISNMSKHKIPQALRSRALCADVSMTRYEIVSRMTAIVETGEFMKEVDQDIKMEALQFVSEHAHNPMVTELNLRSLIAVVKVRVSKPKHWQRLGLYAMANA